MPAKVYMPKAREAALHALHLDDSLAEAHTSLASVAQNLDWDWPTAEREYRRAIELNPNYATAHHWYAGMSRPSRPLPGSLHRNGKGS